jgi:predicted transcriptional regulator
MITVKPKSRMISIRLSDEEYSSIKTVCDSYGARSVSDFTRTALNSFVQHQDSQPSTPVEHRFAEIDNRLDSLARRMEEVFVLQTSPSRD